MSTGRAARYVPLAVAAAATLTQLAIAARCAGPAGAGTVPVAVSRGLRKGEKITPERVEFSLEVSKVSAEAFLSPADLDELEGRYLTRDVAGGLPVPLDFLSERPVLGADVTRIPPGRVLFPLPVKLGALSTLVDPGSKVDVLAHMTLPDSGVVTETLLERADVVSVGERPSDDGRSEGDVVSFHLTHEEAKLLLYAQKFSEFFLALRNPKESTPSGPDAAMTISRFLANPRIRAALADDVFRIRTGGESQ